MPELMDLMKKALLTGVGLALKSKDEVEDLAKEFEKKLEMSEQDGRKFLKEFQDKYDEAQDKLEKRVEKAVREFMKKADLVTADELKALKKEVRELKKAISQENEEAE